MFPLLGKPFSKVLCRAVYCLLCALPPAPPALPHAYLVAFILAQWLEHNAYSVKEPRIYVCQEAVLPILQINRTHSSASSDKGNSPCGSLHSIWPSLHTNHRLLLSIRQPKHCPYQSSLLTPQINDAALLQTLSLYEGSGTEAKLVIFQASRHLGYRARDIQDRVSLVGCWLSLQPAY